MSQYNQWALDEKRKKNGLIFRGHSDSNHTLQTSFHRNGRRDLIRYSVNDIPELARHISATIGRSFSTSNPEEHGELLYLAQHHGYPTPLLDWTESPHIAAYFSFQGLNKFQNDYKEEQYVRIYQFDKDLWHKKHNVVQDIHDPVPAFSAHLLNARDNKRALPQQSVVTFSNVYNIEFFISCWEKKDDMKYLTIVDIPKSDRNSAMKDLGNMGITASSLFPGLDGTCNALREKHF
jgi:FRG domain-containing protein